MIDVERVLAERPELAARARRLAARDLASWRGDEPGLQIVDVRNPAEQEAGEVPPQRPRGLHAGRRATPRRFAAPATIDYLQY